MLTSADVKWKCMWYLLVWSILLTLVSLYLQVQQHVAFYIFATASVLLLPFFTAIYSNTAGRHGAGLLRAGLVFCDPVLSCLTITPVLLLNHLAVIIEQHRCLAASRAHSHLYNCTHNGTRIRLLGQRANDEDRDLSLYDREALLEVKCSEFLVLQAALIVPVLLVFIMGRRTRKMGLQTQLLSGGYWLISAVEAGCLLEILLLSDAYKHVIVTTEAITCIATIGANTYAVVTLLSYVNPSRGFVGGGVTSHRQFTLVYAVFMATVGILFAELPMLVARIQVIAHGTSVLPGSFYLWLVKNCVFIGLVAAQAYMQRFGSLRLPCKPRFDNKHFFQPEKRDKYISQALRAAAHAQRFNSVSSDSESDLEGPEGLSAITQRGGSGHGAYLATSGGMPKCKSVPNMFSDYELPLKTEDGRCKSTTHLDSLVVSHKDKSLKERLGSLNLPLLSGRWKLPKSSLTSGKVNKNKHVSFKLEIGRGKFMELKARSNSPPVFRDYRESGVQNGEYCPPQYPATETHNAGSVTHNTRNATHNTGNVTQNTGNVTHKTGNVTHNTGNVTHITGNITLSTGNGAV